MRALDTSPANQTKRCRAGTTGSSSGVGEKKTRPLFITRYWRRRRREWKARTVYSLGSGHVPTDRTASAGGSVTPTGECTRAPPRYTACSSSPFHRNSDGHPDQINLRLAGRIAKTRPRFCLTVCSPLHLLSSSSLPNLFFSFLFRNKLRLFL
jgi:hypothetical protein